MIFRIDPSSDRYLAPQYVPERPQRSVAFMQRLFGRPLFRYKYSGYIHASVILHFYSEYGKHVQKRVSQTGAADDYLIWKSGIFIRKEADTGTSAKEEVVLVIFNRDGSTIDICPREQMKRTPLIDDIVRIFDRITAGQDNEKLVSIDGKNFVPIEYLCQNASAGIQWFEVDNRSYRVPDFSGILPDNITNGMAMVKVFISYASEDLAYAKALRGHLSILKRTGMIDMWYDQEIKAGEIWDETINAELKASDIILLLLSPDFLDSDYILDVELKEAIKRHNSGDAHIVPIVVRPCVWKDLKDVSKFQIPRKGKPIVLARNEDQAWTEVVNDLKKIIQGNPLMPIPVGNVGSS